MRKHLALFAGLGLALSLGLAGPASATVVAIPNASLSIRIGTFPPIVFAWAGTGTADVTATSITDLTAGIFSLTNRTVPVTDPGALPIIGIFIPSASNGVGNFHFDAAGNSTGNANNTMAVNGSANVGIFPGPIANVVVPFTIGADGIGTGGAPITSTGLVDVTVQGNGWTTGTVVVGTQSVSGFPWNGTRVTLVTPVEISVDPIPGGALRPAFAIFTLVLPEPATILLFGTGLAGLALLARQRTR